MDPVDLPPIVSRSSFARAVQLALEHAADERVRELCFVDPDFADWPLSEPAVLAALTRWVGPKRHLLMVAHSFDGLAQARGQARFVAWRRTWAHLMSCQAARELGRAEIPSLLLGSPQASLQRLESSSSRGRWLTSEDDCGAWREVVDAVLQRSEDAFPAHTLGL